MNWNFGVQSPLVMSKFPVERTMSALSSPVIRTQIARNRKAIFEEALVDQALVLHDPSPSKPATEGDGFFDDAV